MGGGDLYGEDEMSEETKTFVRVRPGADNCTIDSCEAVVPEGSNRSFVDTAAKNTVVKRSRMIEVGRKVLKKKGRLIIGLVLLGALADAVTLVTMGQSLLWGLFFK